MKYARLVSSVRLWVESKLGISLPETGVVPIPVVAVDHSKSDTHPLWAVRIADSVSVVARQSWVERLRPVVRNLPSDLMFSVFGAYELSRVTLPEGVGVWGPSWYLFADKDMWHSVDDDRPVRLSDEEMKSVDRKVFWHCFVDEPVAGFGVFQGNELIGLATVNEVGGSVMEIAMDGIRILLNCLKINNNTAIATIKEIGRKIARS